MKKLFLIPLTLLATAFGITSCGSNEGLAFSKGYNNNDKVEINKLERLIATCDGTFKEGDTISRDDISVIGVYTNGSKEQIYNWTSHQFVDSDTYELRFWGDFEIYINYQDLYTTLSIYVEKRNIISISAVCDKTFKVDTFITRDDLVVTAHYENNYDVVVTDWTSTDFKNFRTHKLTEVGLVPIHVSFEGKDTICYVKVIDKKLIALQAKVNRIYYTGSSIRKTEIQVTAFYDNDTNIVVTSSKWNSVEFGNSSSFYFPTAGKYYFHITYENIETILEVTVIDPYMDSLVASCDLTFVEGDVINKDDILVTGHYVNETYEIIESPDWTSTEFGDSTSFDLPTAGTYYFHIQHNGLETICPIVVHEPFLESISASCSGSYRDGDTINKDEIIVTGHYSNGTTKIIPTADWTSPEFGDGTTYTFTSAGPFTFHISHDEHDTTLTLNIRDPEMESISASCDRIFIVGDIISKDYITVNGHFNNGSTTLIGSGDWTSTEFGDSNSFKFTRSGKHTFHIFHNGLETTLDIIVQEPGLTGITATISKDVWKIEDTLERSEITVTAHYENGTTAVIALDKWESSLFPTDELLLNNLGPLTIPVFYNGKETTVDITVEDLVLEWIGASHEGTYEIGDTIDKDKFTVTAHYDNGKVVTLTSDQWQASQFSSSNTYKFETAGSNDFVITYNGKSATDTVYVNEGKIVSIKATEYIENYDAGDTFTLFLTTIMGYTKHGYSRRITNYCQFSYSEGEQFLTAGQRTVKVSYYEGEKELTCSYIITVTGEYNPGYSFGLEIRPYPRDDDLKYDYWVGDVYRYTDVTYWLVNYTNGTAIQLDPVRMDFDIDIEDYHQFTIDDVSNSSYKTQRLITACYHNYEYDVFASYCINIFCSDFNNN